MERNKIKVYISSSLENAEMVSELSILLEEENIEITYKWWEDSFGEKKDLNLLAKNDLQGIKDSDYVICLRFVNIKKTGTIYELGAADVLGKPVFLYGFNISGVFSCRINHRPGFFSLLCIVEDFIKMTKNM